MKKIIIIYIIISSLVYGKNIKVQLDEGGINKFIQAVGSFTKTTKVMGNEIIWKIYDAELDLKSKKPIFTSKIDIITENKARSGTIEGDAKFTFNGKTQTLFIDIDGMKVRGLDIFNIVGLYRPKYELPIKIMQKEKIAVREDGKITSYDIPRIYNEKVTVIQGTVLIEADISFELDK